MANHIAEVSKILGVELGEPFKITDDTHANYRRYYRFTEKVGIEASDDGVEWEMTTAGALKCLLMGYVRIVKLPWKPKIGENYYVPFMHYSEPKMFIQYRWRDSDRDNKFYRFGSVCQTKDEAIALMKKMLAAINEQ